MSAMPLFPGAPNPARLAIASRLASALEILPPSCDVLRDYQREQISTVSRALRNGYHRPIAQAPTGSGKTHSMTAITAAASFAEFRVLILATRTRLVRQIHERLDAFGVTHGVLAAELPELRNLMLPVQVASADTMYRRCLGEGHTPLPTADVVIFDEAHLAGAKSRLAVLESYPDAVRIGFTATPARKSGGSLSAAFDCLIPGPSVSALIRAGQLVRPRIFNTPIVSAEELKAVPKDAASDYAPGALGDLMSRPKLVGDVISNWLRLANGKRSLLFACNKAHAAALAEEFGRNGVAAELLTDQDDEATREAVFARLEAGATKVVCNVFLAAYGVDLPAVECVVLARPTRSLTMYLQMVGRGMRPAPGKDHFTLIDHGRVVETLGLPTADFAWTLDNSRNVNAEARTAASRRSSAEQPRTCPECSHMWLVSEDGNACTECGWTPAPKAKDIRVQQADLAELDTERSASLTPNSPAVTEFYRMACGWDMKRSGNLWKGADPSTGKSNSNKRRFVAWIRTRDRYKFSEDTRMPSAYWNLAPMEPSIEAAGWLKYNLIRWQHGKGRAA